MPILSANTVRNRYASNLFDHVKSLIERPLGHLSSGFGPVAKDINKGGIRVSIEKVMIVFISVKSEIDDKAFSELFARVESPIQLVRVGHTCSASLR